MEIKPTPEFVTVTELPNDQFGRYWKTIIGAMEQKRQLTSYMDVCLFPEIFFSWRRRHNSSDLLPIFIPRTLCKGAPGTGKTILAKACADRLARKHNIKIFFVEVGSLRSKFEGESARNVQRLYEYIREISITSPVVLFIDEFDSVGVARNTEQMHETVRDMVNALIREMNKQQNGKIFTVAATNLEKQIDKATKRRFGLILEFPRPSYDDRVELLEFLTAGWNLSRFVIALIARRTEGFTQDDITRTIHLAELDAFFNNEGMAGRHIVRSLKKVKPTEDY